MLYCSIIIIVFLIILSKVIYKDMICPAVLVGVPWLLSMLLLLYSHFDFDKNSLYFLYFTLGIFVFQIGYGLTSSKKVRNIEKQYIDKNIFVNNTLIKAIILIELIIMIIYIISLGKFIRSAFVFNVFFTLKIGMANGTLAQNSFIKYFISFTTTFTAYVVFVYIKSINLKNKKTILKIQLIIGMIYAMLTFARTGILLYCILILVEMVVFLNIRNGIILKYMTIFGFAGLVIFSIYSLAKYPYLLQTKSPIDVSLEMLSVYASGSMVVFQKWAGSNIELLYGGNSFRFFGALLKAVGYDLNVQGLVHPFLNIGENTTSNVYTFYYFYAIDFGLIYALIIQFLVGMFHGFLYKKMTYKNPLWVFIFALSFYPLFMQFFEDQYFSLTSLWLQCIFYGLIFFKTKLFIQYENTNKLQIDIQDYPKKSL